VPINRSMNGPVLDGTMRLTIVGMIGVAGLSAMLFGYQAMLLLIDSSLVEGAGRAALSAAFTLATYLLARYRNDLIDC
jgi:hypothetical protein